MPRTFFLPLVLSFAALSCRPAPPPTSPAPASSGDKSAALAPPKSPVVVTMVIDQMGAWMAMERWPTLPATGGFARLLREGTYVREAHHEHACTDTAPGHAELYTGAPARVTGIFGNEVVDPVTRKRVSVLRDESTHLVGEAGETKELGSSIARLRVETLADRLKAERPDALVFSLSLKDRGAIFGGGRHPDASIWFEPSFDAFVTATPFGSSLPSFVIAEGSHAAVVRARAPWTPLDLKWLEEHAGTPDEQAGEGDWHGFGTTFPHDVAKARKPGTVFRASPMGDDRLFAMATALLADSRLGTVPTLLAMSMSTHDYVSHIFGPDSWESWDELLRLDASLGRFLESLDRRFGTAGWSLVLSADHGATNMPETASIPGTHKFCKDHVSNDHWKRLCEPGDRIILDEMTRFLEEAAVRALGPGDWVMGSADPYVYLTDKARALPPADREKLRAALTKRLLADPRVARVVEPHTFAASCPGDEDESVEALLCRAIPDQVAGELYVVTKPGVFFDADYTPGKGTSHGTPYLYDRAVPILARSVGHIPAGATETAILNVSTFARTAATLLEIGAPQSTVGGRSLAK